MVTIICKYALNLVKAKAGKSQDFTRGIFNVSELRKWITTHDAVWVNTSPWGSNFIQNFVGVRSWRKYCPLWKPSYFITSILECSIKPYVRWYWRYNVYLEISKIRLSSNSDEFNDKMKNNKIIFSQIYNDLRVWINNVADQYMIIRASVTKSK